MVLVVLNDSGNVLVRGQCFLVITVSVCTIYGDIPAYKAESESYVSAVRSYPVYSSLTVIMLVYF